MTASRLIIPAIVWGTYFTLGEISWFPILPGTADPYDIPAALVGCLCPVLLAYMPGSSRGPIVMPRLLFALYFIGTVIGNYLYYRLI